MAVFDEQDAWNPRVPPAVRRIAHELCEARQRGGERVAVLHLADAAQADLRELGVCEAVLDQQDPEFAHRLAAAPETPLRGVSNSPVSANRARAATTGSTALFMRR